MRRWCCRPIVIVSQARVEKDPSTLPSAEARRTLRFEARDYRRNGQYAPDDREGDGEVINRGTESSRQARELHWRRSFTRLWLCGWLCGSLSQGFTWTK